MEYYTAITRDKTEIETWTEKLSQSYSTLNKQDMFVDKEIDMDCTLSGRLYTSG